MFKETTLACLFDIGGLVAGFAIAWQLGIFDLAPWTLALYPAVISVKGVITGLLTGRLSTALHLGTVYPKFFGNTKSFYKLIGAMVVLNLATSITIGLIALGFGTLFWGITFADFTGIVAVMIATLSLGLLVTLITVYFTLFSFKRSLDPDTVVYPAISTVANIIMTFLYIAVLHVYFSGLLGEGLIVLFGLINVFLVLFILPLNMRDREFRRTLRESLPTMLLVAVLVNITGTLLKGINGLANGRREIFTVYPAIIDMMGDAGLVINSAATVKLTLGVLSPTLASIKCHAKNIVSAWISTVILFIILGVLSLAINGLFTVGGFFGLLVTLLLSNVVAFVLIAVVSFGIAILTFKRGLDPDNFVIPVGSALADALTTAALFIALLLIV